MVPEVAVVVRAVAVEVSEAVAEVPVAVVVDLSEAVVDLSEEVAAVAAVPSVEAVVDPSVEAVAVPSVEAVSIRHSKSCVFILFYEVFDPTSDSILNHPFDMLVLFSKGISCWNG